MQKSHRFRLLDIYRGIAALLVVLYHITGEMHNRFNHFNFLGDFFSFGFVGLEFFFVLSGFIIFHVHNKDKSNFISLIRFFKKRFIRIYPSYWAALTIIFVLYLFLNRLNINNGHLNLSFLILSYTLFPHMNRLIPQSWTLTQEIYFYLLFGFLFFVKPPKLRLIVFILISLICFIFSFKFSSFPLIYSFITPYFINFLGGYFAGYVFTYLKKQIKASHFIVICSISLCLFLIALSLDKTFIFMPLISITFGTFIWASGAFEASYSLVFSRILLILGNASYAIYLLHFVIIKLVFKIIYTQAHIIKSEAILLTIGIFTFIACAFLPTLFYIYYEKPAQAFFRKILL